MKQYTAKFQEEHIDGEALAELDDEMMRSDLGISSKFHRTRLMKVLVWGGWAGGGSLHRLNQSAVDISFDRQWHE